jgi:hypothetical protein
MKINNLETFNVKLGVKIFVITICSLIIVFSPFFYESVKDESFYVFLLFIFDFVMIYCILWIFRYKVYLKENSIIRRRIFKKDEIEFNKINKLYFKEKELIIYSYPLKIRLHADLKNISELIEIVSSKVNLNEIIVKK